MTRRDYVKLAACMAATKPAVDVHGNVDRGRRTQWEHDCACLSDTLKADNPRFDRTRFLQACTYSEV